MADHKLLKIYPEASRPKFSPGNLDRARNLYKEIKTFFDMDCYDNPVGIEIEAEDYECLPDSCYLSLWRIDKDNSLRGNGVEFISMPLYRTMIDYALYEAAMFTKNLSFSHRTSIHVHCNVSHYTESQLSNLVAHYALLEKLFFSLVNGDRGGNSFCYPIVSTRPELVIYSNDVEKTTKYCALNVAPIGSQMTVEFRHMHGTGDMKMLRRWVQLCAKLVYYCGNLESEYDLVPKLTSNTFGVEDVQKIWGETTKIFSESEIAYSIESGRLWSTLLLTGVD